MVDIKLLREHLDDYKRAASRKQKKIDFDEVLLVDDLRKQLNQDNDIHRVEQKSYNQKMAIASPEEKSELQGSLKNLANKIKASNEAIRIVEENLETMLLRIPNIMHSSVPDGKDDSENVEIKRFGNIPQFDFTPKDHIEIMKMHDMVDFERGVKLSGSRSYFLKNDGALLHQAVLQYAFRKMVEKGFTPFEVPFMVRPEALVGTGYFPGGEDDAYQLERDDSWLIATAEIPLTAHFSGEILDESVLPQTFVALSPCFRREAGSYGKDTAGLYRVHQFQKVEQVIILPADEALSNEWHEKILNNSMEVLDDLKLPYRLLQLCAGDMAIGKYNSHDIECFMPSRASYGETHSASSFLDFQSRRLKLRYRTKEGEIKYCYTLNNTVIASPRILIAILENNQNADGSIAIPECLVPYMGKNIIA